MIDLKYLTDSLCYANSLPMTGDETFGLFISYIPKKSNKTNLFSSFYTYK